MYQISANRISEIFTLLAKDRKFYIPVRSGSQSTFALWEDGMSYCLEDINTSMSLKEFFFPQSEGIVDFQTKGQSISILENPQKAEPFIVFGASACDIKAAEILDSVFLSEPCDNFYRARREQGTIVAVACGSPEETCFCGAFGIDPSEPSGDVAVWITEKTLYWEAKTEKGETITKLISGLIEQTRDRKNNGNTKDSGDSADSGTGQDAEEPALAQYKKRIREIMAKLPLAALDPSDVGSDLTGLFQSRVWEEMSRACLGCGACTFVCPTCQCYDIQDYDTGNSVKRFRCWDSCMYSDFTLMAHGNPRTSQLERFRQRFMHKLVYFPENNDGEYSCVGCGRCMSKCPVSLHIVKVIKALGVRENAHQ